MRLLSVLILTATLLPAAGQAQSRPQPLIKVSAEAGSATAHPKPRIVRMPWQTGVFQ